MTAKKQILIVEDEGITAKDLQMTLEELGYDVPVTVSCGEDACRVAGERRPDLVIMDVTLQGEMSGIDAADKIRSGFNIPVIYLTAYSDTQIMKKIKETMPYGYIIKPYMEREMQLVIEIAFYKHETDILLQKYREKFGDVE